MFVDSHCHLSDPLLHPRVDEILTDMAAAQVDQALVICTTMEEFDQVQALAVAHGRLWCTVGVHPDTEEGAEPTTDDLVRAAGRERVVGIGETGLDYYRLGERTVADMAWQRDRFRVHIRAARATGLPLVVHTRAASADTLEVLREEGGRAVTGVFHCFTETAEVARAALDLGFYISFSGILTFRNAQDLREVARFVPMDRLLIETDSPYLAPVPHRGRVNSPAWVVEVARQVAALKDLPLETVGEVTSRNFATLFPGTRCGPATVAKEP